MHLFRGSTQHRKRYPRPLQHLERQYGKRISRSEKLRQKRTIECTLCEHSIVMITRRKRTRRKAVSFRRFCVQLKPKQATAFLTKFPVRGCSLFFLFNFSAVRPCHPQSCIFDALCCCAAAFTHEPTFISRICRILLLSLLLSQCPCAASCR